MSRTPTRKRRALQTIAGLVAAGLALVAGSALAGSSPFLRRTAAVEVVEQVGPAVVNITTERVVERTNPFRPFTGDPLFDRFFRQFQMPSQRETVQSLGSGVIFDAEGHVLTNDHVIARASRVFISLADGREFETELVGADPNNDLAVLRVIGATDLPWVAPGSSDDLMVGEPVIAIGNPFGLSNSVTTGVISALNRSIRGDQHAYHGFMQTDASINPGNSGGPLLNAEGTLIGINTAIYNGAEGIGFAIPIDVAKRVIKELLEHGEVQPVWLGLEFQNLDRNLREVMGLPSGVDGALVNRVHPGGPADQGGVRRGDIVARFDGRPVENARALFEMLEPVTARQKLTLEVWRDEKLKKIVVRAEEVPDEVVERLTERMLGFELEAMSGGGFRVSSVTRGSNAETIGLRRDDVILAINGLPLAGNDELRRAVLNLRGRDRALVVVQRGNGRYHVTIPFI